MHATSEVPKQVAAGKPLLEDVRDRDLAETLQWVVSLVYRCFISVTDILSTNEQIEYVNENSNQMAQKLFKVTEEVAKYVAWKERYAYSI
jgi:hypothetical protein